MCFCGNSFVRLYDVLHFVNRNNAFTNMVTEIEKIGKYLGEIGDTEILFLIYYFQMPLRHLLSKGSRLNITAERQRKEFCLAIIHVCINIHFNDVCDLLYSKTCFCRILAWHELSVRRESVN